MKGALKVRFLSLLAIWNLRNHSPLPTIGDFVPHGELR
jgi:hypothetical protein